MDRLDQGAVAELAGVGTGFVAEVVRLGLVIPEADGRLSPGDLRRVKLMDTLHRAGVPLEGIARAKDDGLLSFAFLDALSYDRLPTFRDVTFEQTGEETGLPVDLLMVIREVIGRGLPSPNDRMRAEELSVVPLLQYFWDRGVSVVALERLLRVLGDNLRRIAESEADWWRTELVPVLGRAADPVLDPSGDISTEATRRGDQAMMAIYHAQQGDAWMKNMIETVETTLEEAGLYSRPERVPAISFLDMTGYTRLTEAEGDVVAANLADNLSRMVQRIALRHGGEPVKRLGDGVMFHYPDPGSGVLAALEMVAGVAEAGLPPTHVGMDAGPVFFQDGEYYGRTVNMASRIADFARPGEVLVSQAVVDSTNRPDVVFHEVGAVELRGVVEPARLWSARRAD